MYDLEFIQNLVLELINKEIISHEPITDLDSSGFDQGLDSMSAVDITTTLEEKLKIPLDPSLFWEFDNLRSMCEYIYKQILENG